MTKTQRLIQRIQEKESFYDVAYVCEDFETFEIEVAEWGVDHIAGVTLTTPNLTALCLTHFLLHSVVLQAIRTPAQNTH